MAATTLTEMPSVIYAGDTLLLKIDLSDYPATDWTLTYEFRRKLGSTISFSSTPDGSSHSFSVAAETTNIWVDGDYTGVGSVSDGTQKFTVWTGRLTILPNLSAQEDNYDTRSHAEICLDALNAVIEGKASRDVLNTTIAGQTIGRMSFKELLEARNYYAALVEQELASLDAANGKGGKNVLIRFSQPT